MAGARGPRTCCRLAALPPAATGAGHHWRARLPAHAWSEGGLGVWMAFFADGRAWAQHGDLLAGWVPDPHTHAPGPAPGRCPTCRPSCSCPSSCTRAVRGYWAGGVVEVAGRWWLVGFRWGPRWRCAWIPPIAACPQPLAQGTSTDTRRPALVPRRLSAGRDQLARYREETVPPFFQYMRTKLVGWPAGRLLSVCERTGWHGCLGRWHGKAIGCGARLRQQSTPLLVPCPPPHSPAPCAESGGRSGGGDQPLRRAGQHHGAHAGACVWVWAQRELRQHTRAGQAP